MPFNTGVPVLQLRGPGSTAGQRKSAADQTQNKNTFPEAPFRKVDANTEEGCWSNIIATLSLWCFIWCHRKQHSLSLLQKCPLSLSPEKPTQYINLHERECYLFEYGLLDTGHFASKWHTRCDLRGGGTVNKCNRILSASKLTDLLHVSIHSVAAEQGISCRATAPHCRHVLNRNFMHVIHVWFSFR